MTNEEKLEQYKKDLRAEGMSHLSKEYKEKVKEKEIELGLALEEVVPVITQTPKTEEVVEEKESRFPEIDPEANYLFKLIGSSSKSYIIPREATAWDEIEQRPRKIRYVKTESSPFVDEQDEFAVADKGIIYFIDGQKIVNGKDAALIRYLLAYDGNADKKKVMPNCGVRGLYKLHDPQAEAKQKRKVEEVKTKARVLIEQTGYEKLQAYARSIFKRDLEGEDAVKTFLYDKVSADVRHAENLLSDLNSPKHLVKYKIVKALAKGLIKTSGDKVMIASTGNVIVRYDTKDPNNSYDEVLAKHILEEKEGYQDILKLINS